MQTVNTNAVKILEALEEAQYKLIGNTAVKFNGEADIVASVHLDEDHGLIFQYKSDVGTSVRWPVSTIKYVVSP